MTEERAQLWQAITQYANCIDQMLGHRKLIEAIERCTDTLILATQAETIASLERGVNGENGVCVYPNWVYQARQAIQHMNNSVPSWFTDLLEALQWDGGSIFEALQAVRRLVFSDKEKHKEGERRRIFPDWVCTRCSGRGWCIIDNEPNNREWKCEKCKGSGKVS